MQKAFINVTCHTTLLYGYNTLSVYFLDGPIREFSQYKLQIVLHAPDNISLDALENIFLDSPDNIFLDAPDRNIFGCP